MNSAVLSTIAVTGFTVAFFHAAIPTHWLPFVLVSRARGWSRGKTLAVATLAGLGHVAITSLLGLVIAWFGFQLDEKLGHWFPWIAGGILIAIGAFYFWRQWTGGGVRHHHVVVGAPSSDRAVRARGGPQPLGGRVEGQRTRLHPERRLGGDQRLAPDADAVAVRGLPAGLPVRGPVWLVTRLRGAQSDPRGGHTLAAHRLVFTWLTLVGLERVQVRKFERPYEAGLLGRLVLRCSGSCCWCSSIGP